MTEATYHIIIEIITRPLSSPHKRKPESNLSASQRCPSPNNVLLPQMMTFAQAKGSYFI